MRRTGRVMTGIALAAAVAVLGLAGCGRFGANDAVDTDTTNLSWEAQALEAIGYTTNDLGPSALVAEATAVPTSPTAAPTASKERRGKFKRLRFAFGKKVLHAEGVVETNEGTKTVVVQRGAVTAVTATTITVKSTDGYTISWTIGDKFTVVKDREKVDKAAVTVGATVGIAGAKDGATTTARLVVLTPR